MNCLLRTTYYPPPTTYTYYSLLTTCCLLRTAFYLLLTLTQLLATTYNYLQLLTTACYYCKLLPTNTTATTDYILPFLRLLPHRQHQHPQRHLALTP